MKKIIFSFIMLLLSFVAKAQESTLHYGYISYKEAVKALPDYEQAQQNMAALKAKYDAEMQRVEDEFNKKYEDFLAGQRDFAPSILRKRQAELQELMQKNVAFKAEAQRLLQQAEQDSNNQLYNKLNATIEQLAAARNLSFVLNTDNNAVPFINKVQAEDLLPLVKDALK
ncbi:MAG: OmpH family outer membrane protein [Prevotella nanceiensis]|jgi:putative cationic outer membrane protein ompH|nr:OmpH family outer membrane protein [Hoylesella nanceiensis]